MKVIQMLTTLAYGDAVSNDARAIQKLLTDAGYKTAIYADNIDPRLARDRGIYNCGTLPKTKEDDIILYHLSIGSRLNEEIKHFNCRKIVIYHNITPPHYLAPFSGVTAGLCKQGYEQTESLCDTFDMGFCDSDYNLQELRRMGYKCPLYVRPILIPFEDYEQPADEAKIEEIKNLPKAHNLLFLGRIAANKKQEDLISMLYTYKQMFKDDPVRLILVGSSSGMEKFEEKLMNYAEILGVKNDVVFTGHVPFKQILSYYKACDCFVCMSEHEGFCVPLVEAMYFDLPIVALKTSAIPSTLGGSGVLIENKDYMQMAAAVHEVVNDDTLKEEILEDQRERLKDFTYESVSKLLLGYLDEFINKADI